MNALRSLMGLPRWLARRARALSLLVIASFLTLALGSTGALRKLESATLDLQADLRQSPEDGPVALVLIARSDYRALFGGRSPLDPRPLEKIIEAIAATSPKAIVVNIDTSSPGFADFPHLAAGPPVIWAQGADYSRREKKFLPKVFLGGKPAGRPAGLTPQKVDGDGVIRRYQHLYLAGLGPRPSPRPSLAWATVCVLRGQDPLKAADPRNEFFLRFGISRPPFKPTAGAVLKMAQAPEWRQGSLLTGKVVVLGAAYSVADEHETPIGWKLGSEIVAQAIETEMAGERVAPVSLPVLLLLQILQGVLLLLLFQALQFRTALAASLVAIPGLAAAFSLGAFGTLSHWGQFAPILLAVLVQQVYEKARDARSRLVKTAGEALAQAPPMPSMPPPPRRRRTVTWWRPRRRRSRP